MTHKALVLFAGGGGVEIGLGMAGIHDVTGIEYDDDIAAVARLNGHNTLTADVLDIDPNDYTDCTVLHASPPCPNFSTAKPGGKEEAADIALGECVARFIEVIQPDYFTLENVYGYRKSKSYQAIERALYALDYGYKYWHLNSADYGVPQTRKRMILIARKDGIIPQRPRATHEEQPSGLFALSRWVGWYEAVEDIVHTFEPSQLANWQRAVLEKSKYSDWVAGMPNPNASGLKFIEDTSLITGNRPAPTVLAQSALKTKVVLLDGQGNDYGTRITMRSPDEPAHTITATAAKRLRTAEDGGAVYRVNTRALARWQSFPDAYQLPERRTLAARIIGNALPPLMYKAVIEGVVQTS